MAINIVFNHYDVIRSDSNEQHSQQLHANMIPEYIISQLLSLGTFSLPCILVFDGELRMIRSIHGGYGIKFDFMAIQMVTPPSQ
jgi:hypothetical protein